METAKKKEGRMRDVRVRQIPDACEGNFLINTGPALSYWVLGA